MAAGGAQADWMALEAGAGPGGRWQADDQGSCGERPRRRAPPGREGVRQDAAGPVGVRGAAPATKAASSAGSTSGVLVPLRARASAQFRLPLSTRTGPRAFTN